MIEYFFMSTKWSAYISGSISHIEDKIYLPSTHNSSLNFYVSLEVCNLVVRQAIHLVQYLNIWVKQFPFISQKVLQTRLAIHKQDKPGISVCT